MGRLNSFTDQTGKKHDGPSTDQYLEIYRFPTESTPGSGKYFVNANVVSEFSFQNSAEGHNSFVAKQVGGAPFRLEAECSPVDRSVIGFRMAFPNSAPLFEAKFQRERQFRVRIVKKRRKTTRSL